MNLMSEPQIEKIINLMRSDDSADAPADARAWAKNIFLSRAAAPKKSFAQKVLAVLQMDLSPNKAAFGERSASTTQARQMLFQAGDYALDLRITQTGNDFDLHGQILGADFADASIFIGEFEARADEMSEFKFMKIPAGKYDVRLRSGETEIVIENFELK